MMRTLPVLLVGVALLGVACGDDDDSVGDESRSTTEAASEVTGGATTDVAFEEAPVALEGQVNDEGTDEIDGEEMEVELDDFYFGPTFIKAIPGTTVTLELENEGDTTHTFTSDGLGVDQEVSAGEKAEVEVTLPAEGAVAFYCRFHKDRGMQGAFFFKEGDVVVTGARTSPVTTDTALSGY
jgi:plastocyanin